MHARTHYITLIEHTVLLLAVFKQYLSCDKENQDTVFVTVDYYAARCTTKAVGYFASGFYM